MRSPRKTVRFARLQLVLVPFQGHSKHLWTPTIDRKASKKGASKPREAGKKLCIEWGLNPRARSAAGLKSASLDLSDIDAIISACYQFLLKILTYTCAAVATAWCTIDGANRSWLPGIGEDHAVRTAMYLKILGLPYCMRLGCCTMITVC
jgi:hypothetical protein